MEILIPTALAMALSLLSPVIVGLLTKASWSPKTKGWVALGLSAVIALGWLIATGGFSGLAWTGNVELFVQALATALAGAYALQQAVYALMYKGTEFAQSVLHSGVTDGESDATGSGFDAELDPELEGDLDPAELESESDNDPETQGLGA